VVVWRALVAASRSFRESRGISATLTASGTWDQSIGRVTVRPLGAGLSRATRMIPAAAFFGGRQRSRVRRRAGGRGPGLPGAPPRAGGTTGPETFNDPRFAFREKNHRV
jgi:hypothetical protein